MTDDRTFCGTCGSEITEPEKSGSAKHMNGEWYCTMGCARKAILDQPEKLNTEAPGA